MGSKDPTRVELEVNDGRDTLSRQDNHHEHNCNNKWFMHNLPPYRVVPTIIQDHEQNDLRVVIIWWVCNPDWPRKQLSIPVSK